MAAGKKWQNSGYQDWTNWVLSAYLRKFHQVFAEILIFNFFLVGGSIWQKMAS